MENRALGKGLSALIPDRTRLEKSEKVSFIKTSEIKENPFQPRTNYNDAKLSELIASIKEKGVIQPILVRQAGNTYEVIAGERRLRAARSLKIEEIPVIVKAVSDQEALVLALVENIQREELNAIEEARAFKRLIEDFNFTQDAVAQSVGKDRSTISNLLRLLKLPEEIQKSVFNEEISEGHARALLSVENGPAQKKLFDLTIKKTLSVRELENLIRSGIKGSARRLINKTGAKDHYVIVIEEDLQRILGTKVRINAQKKRGKIVIEYYSSDDLERIMNIIKGNG